MERVLSALKIDTDLNRRWYCRKTFNLPGHYGQHKINNDQAILGLYTVLKFCESFHVPANLSVKPFA